VRRDVIDPYRRLALHIIWQAILDRDKAFFYTPWFEALADMLGYSAEGMRELALQRMDEMRRQNHARRRRGSRSQKDGDGTTRA